MLALAIDTATEICSIALGNSENVIGSISFEAGRSHLEMLFPAVEQLLGRQNIDARRLEFIAVGTGPGNFSGLRVGIATCRALSQSLGIPLQGSSSLAALAAGAAGSPGLQGQPLLMAAINARRGQVFAQIYRKHNRKVTPLSEIYCLDPGDLVEVVTKAASGPMVAAGDGVLAYPEIFYSAPAIQALPPQDKRHQVQAAHHLPEAGCKKKYSPQDLMEVLPEYVREPDADKTVLLRKRQPWQ